jgi:hypothetical protein
LKVATKTIDPFDVFKQAWDFMHCDEILRGTDHPGQMAIVVRPAIVLSAFASELFLKCLLLIEGKGTHNTHDLHVLYKKLSKGTQALIKSKWDFPTRRAADIALTEKMSGQKMPTDFESALSRGGKAFKYMRYIFEDPLSTDFFLADLPRMLQAVILELKPEWNHAVIHAIKQVA